VHTSMQPGTHVEEIVLTRPGAGTGRQWLGNPVTLTVARGLLAIQNSRA
jgi:hypothetical protein